MRSTSVSVDPRLVDGHVHGEVVHEFHRRRSSRVSMSAGLPGHATSGDEFGAIPHAGPARPSSPLVGSRDHTVAAQPHGVAAAAVVGGDADRASRRHAATGAPRLGGDQRLVGQPDDDGVVAVGSAPRSRRPRSDVIWPVGPAGLRSHRDASRAAPASTAPVTTIVSSRPAPSGGVDGPAGRAGGPGTAPAACAPPAKRLATTGGQHDGGGRHGPSPA